MRTRRSHLTTPVVFSGSTVDWFRCRAKPPVYEVRTDEERARQDPKRPLRDISEGGVARRSPLTSVERPTGVSCRETRAPRVCSGGRRRYGGVRLGGTDAGKLCS